MDVFDAIHDPTRRHILDLLLERPHSAGALVATFPQMTQPAVSRHLRLLREAGLVSVRVHEQQRIYSLRPEGLEALDQWLERYRPFWQRSLDALEQHLAQMSDDDTP